MSTFKEVKCKDCRFCSLKEESKYDFSREMVVDANCNSEQGPTVAIDSNTSPYNNFLMARMNREARKFILEEKSCFVPKGS